MKILYTIGVDLGGTNLRVGVVDKKGEVELQRSIPVGNNKSANCVINLICREVLTIQKKYQHKILGVGCGIPGIVDAERGIVYSSPNYPGWKDVPILKLLRKKIRLPIVIDNDANMFALAELLYGAGRGCKNLIMLTLGSGIGGGIVIDGKVFHGDRGFAGEVGHIVVEPEGRPCGCGGRGCWEMYAASHAFDRSPEAVARLAKGGDKDAKKIWQRYGKYLGIGIASLVNAFGITTIVIGGGIAKSWDLFIDSARKEIEARTYKENIRHLKLLKASLGGSTGIAGAASAVTL